MATRLLPTFGSCSLFGVETERVAYRAAVRLVPGVYAGMNEQLVASVERAPTSRAVRPAAPVRTCHGPPRVAVPPPTSSRAPPPPPPRRLARRVAVLVRRRAVDVCRLDVAYELIAAVERPAAAAGPQTQMRCYGRHTVVGVQRSSAVHSHQPR